MEIKNANNHKKKQGFEKRNSLDLSDIEENEQHNMERFVRVAKRRGTKTAIKTLYGGLQEKSQPLFEKIEERNEDSEKAAILLIQKVNEAERVFSQATESDSDSEFSEELDFEQRRMYRVKKAQISKMSLNELHSSRSAKKKTGIITKNGNIGFVLKSEKMKKKRRCLIDIDNKFKKIWDNTLLALIFYIAIFSPFKISFIDDSAYPYWTYFDYMIDFVFFIDLILTFFTPVYKNFRLIKSHKKIALRYLKVWFWLDLISIIPLDLIFKNESGPGKVLQGLIKMPKLYRMFRLLKIIRAIKLKQKNQTFIAKKLAQFLNSDTLASKIIPLYAIGILISYMFACLWHFVPKENPDRNSWLQRYGFLSEPTHDRFWASVYYIYATVTTTGYGDITPYTKQEFGLTVMFVWFGVSFHSLIYTTMLKNIENYRQKNMKYNEKLKFLNEMKKSISC